MIKPSMRKSPKQSCFYKLTLLYNLSKTKYIANLMKLSGIIVSIKH